MAVKPIGASGVVVAAVGDSGVAVEPVGASGVVVAVVGDSSVLVDHVAASKCHNIKTLIILYSIFDPQTYNADQKFSINDDLSHG